MMNAKPASVAGDWTGVFDFGEVDDDPVPFTAMLFDVVGAVWGQTRERNSFAPELGPELFASVSGSRSGREVIFTKAYDGPPIGGEFPVTYAGLLSPDGQRIEGQWSIPAFGPERTGPFRMDRLPGQVRMTGKARRLAESVTL